MIMNRIYLIFLLFFSIQISVFAQTNLKHKVVQGESIYSIAKKHDITENDIYQLNPKIKGNLLQLNTILLIPKSNSNKKTEDFHILISGDTFFSIAKKHNLTVSELKNYNPSISEKSLKIGDKILLQKQQIVTSKIKDEKPVVLDDDEEENDDSGEITHVISKGETLYSISKKYQTSIKQLEELNPRLSDKLNIGYKLIIKKGIALSNIPLVNVNDKSNEDELDINEDIPYSIENSSKANQLIQIASQHLGTHYRSGGTTAGGFDCSGLMFYTYGQLDLKLPRSSNDQSQIGKKISKKKALKGDLIFFSTNGRGTINHVGMITEVYDDEILFIHSSVHNGVIVSSTNEAYYSKRFKGIKRVL